MKIVLFEPQIPQNTGNIVRTCSITGSSLTLVKPLGFSISSSRLKRAGLDHWEGVTVEVIDDLFAFIESLDVPFAFLSSHATKTYDTIPFTEHTVLIFGSETAGLPHKVHQQWPEHFYTIPMLPGKRCLNLATSAGIVLYEGLRQLSFPL